MNSKYVTCILAQFHSDLSLEHVAIKLRFKVYDP